MNDRWVVVKFLVDHGFHYQHILEPETIDKTENVKYPDNLREAKEFVIKYKNQVRK